MPADRSSYVPRTEVLQDLTVLTALISIIAVITEAVQRGSALAEETAASSEELTAQARMLRDLVERFQLKNN